MEITALVHPVCRGIRRAVEGLRLDGSGALLHGLDVDLPWRSSVPSVTTVHDLSVFDVPWASNRIRVHGERALIRKALRSADAIVAVSSFTAERVRALFGRDATVIPLAPGRAFSVPDDDAVRDVRDRYHLPERFVLQVGTIEPRKDVGGLNDACREIDVPLVLAGRLDGPAPTGALALGYVPLADLPPLYRSATVVAYISSYEGFGLPPVEAAACGAMVVASRVGAVPDVLGEGAGIVPVGDGPALVAALRRACSDDDYRAATIAEAGRRMAELSWARNARATLDVYRSLGVSC